MPLQTCILIQGQVEVDQLFEGGEQSLVAQVRGSRRTEKEKMAREESREAPVAGKPAKEGWKWGEKGWEGKHRPKEEEERRAS